MKKWCVIAAIACAVLAVALFVITLCSIRPVSPAVHTDGLVVYEVGES